MSAAGGRCEGRDARAPLVEGMGIEPTELESEESDRSLESSVSKPRKSMGMAEVGGAACGRRGA